MVLELVDELIELADHGQSRRWSGSQRRLKAPGFDGDDLDLLIESDGGSTGHYRFMKQGVLIDPKILQLTDPEGSLIPDRVNSLKRQGITIIASRLESKLQFVGEFAFDLQREFGCYVRAVGIASFGSVFGMPRHFDHVDVFVVQTVGTKKWRFFGNPIEGPGVPRKVENEPAQQSASTNLQAGDQLFVPAGIFHQCDPAELSFHIAFNLKWPCALDLLGIRYKENDAYPNALLEPIRWFGQQQRLDTLTDRFGPLLKKYSYSGNLKVDLAGWPKQCEERFAAAT